MDLTETPNEIIIRAAPVGQWITGGVLLVMLAGFILWLIYFGFNPSGASGSVAAALLEDCAILTVVIAAIWGFVAIKFLCAPLLIVAISQNTKSVNISRRRFYGARTERFYFTQIEKFKSYKVAANYYLALILANRKTTKLKLPLGREKKKTGKFIRKLNKFVKSGKLLKQSAG